MSLLRTPPAHGLTVRARLWFGFGVVIVCAGIISCLAIVQSHSLAVTMTDLNSHDLPEVVTLEYLHTSVLQLHDLTRQVATGTAQDAANNQTNVHDLIQQISAQNADMLRYEPPNVRPAITTNLASTLTRLSTTLQTITDAAMRQNPAQAQSLELNETEPDIHLALRDLRQLNTLETSEAAHTGAQAQQDSEHATMLTLLLAGVVVATSLLFAWLLSRAISQPLTRLLQATEAISGGDLETSSPMTRRDEFGRLGRAFEIMRQHLRTTIATLARERQQTQAIIDASADGILLIDAHGIIQQANPASARLCGEPLAHMIGQPYDAVLRLPDQTVLITDASSDDATPSLHHHQRGERWLAISVASSTVAAEGDRMQGWIIGLHDITQLKAVERMQSDFVALVSHELRAPLTTVTSSVELLGALDLAQQGETYHEVVGILTRQTQRLGQVIEEVLQLTRLDAGRLQVHLVTMPVVTACKNILARVQLDWLGEGRQLDLVDRSTGDRLVCADPNFLEIVLRNVLENARKYTPSGSPIMLTVQPEAATERVIIQVRDHGPGIAPADREAIFGRFIRGPTTPNVATHGFGLGLYIARELVRAMHGEIWIEGDNEGAIVMIALCSAPQLMPTQ